MKLMNVLSTINQLEKTKFLNFLDKICAESAAKDKGIEKKLKQFAGQIKQASSSEIKDLFDIVFPYFKKNIKYEISLLGAQADVLIRILSRDGNSIARVSWIEQLYKKDLDTIDLRSEELKRTIETDIGENTKKINIYKNCFEVAFKNDEKSNREARISYDERTVLNELSRQLVITDDERIIIEHLICPIPRESVSECLETLREIGLIFISKKTQTVYVPNEIIDMLHEIDGTVLSDKYVRRILRTLSDAELSNIHRAYHKKTRGVARLEKIAGILQMKLDVAAMLTNDMHPSDAPVTEKKARLKRLISDLDIVTDKLGSTLEERASIIIDALKYSTQYEFEVLSSTGFNDMFSWLASLAQAPEIAPSAEERIKDEFELEETEKLDAERLRALSITPFDILYLFSNDENKLLCEKLGVSKRGNYRFNIIESFINASDKLIENYDLLSKRDLSGLRSKGIEISEPEIGIKFEEATKAIFEHLGLVVDEDLRKQNNSDKNKADIIISLNEDDIIIVETKTFKNGHFAKYSSTSRQVKSYVRHYESLGKRVSRVLVIAPDFSRDFITSSETDAEVNISLLEASGLKKMLTAYKSKRKPRFSPMLFTKGVLLNADLLIKTI